MKFTDLVTILNAEVLYKGKVFDSADLANFFVSDMMSEVLVQEKDDMTLITSNASHQTLRTVDNMNGLAVVIVSNKHVQAGMQDLAQEMGITLLRTSKDAFATCLAIGAKMGHA